MSTENKISADEQESLRQARITLTTQQETERLLLTELLDEKPPENWLELARGALAQDAV
jgi:hypothetical protein